MNLTPVRIAVAGAALALAACAHSPRTAKEAAPVFSQSRTTEHRGNDDLLSGGLGLAGLRAMTPPAFADAEHPTPVELRRRALWSNWRGIADLAPGHRNDAAIQLAVAAAGREIGDAAPVAPQRTAAQFGRRGVGRVGECGRYRVAQSGQAQPCG